MSAAAVALAPAATEPATACVHCGLPSGGRRFCCTGCEAAFATIQGLGLGRYYRQRVLDQQARAPRPEAHEPRDFGRYVTTDAAGNATLTLAVDGVQCGACVWLIESVLAQAPELVFGRVNLTTRRLRLVWRGGAERGETLVARVEALGYRLMPFDPALLAAARDRIGRALIRALAVAGFAAGNVMLMSAATWFGLTQGMGPATRALMHWVSALIALPAIAYAGMPFFRSALAALRQRRTNMDVPVSVGVILVSAMSFVESFRGGLHTYFDSAITLLFFLLLGRVLDHQARGQARATAEQLLTLRAADVAVLQPDGSTLRVAHDAVGPAARVLVGMGERVGVDGVVEDGQSTLDASLVTGESVPAAAAPGAAVFAGTLNLGPALIVRATATGAGTLLAECVRLIEAAEARRGRFVVLADRVARRYAPAVHILAAATFIFWWVVMRAGVADSLLTAAAVLIITCPCALALAVPAVQVLATSRLFRAGVLLKSATALERLARGGHGRVRQDRHADRAACLALAGPPPTPRRGGWPPHSPPRAAIRWRARCTRRCPTSRPRWAPWSTRGAASPWPARATRCGWAAAPSAACRRHRPRPPNSGWRAPGGRRSASGSRSGCARTRRRWSPVCARWGWRWRSRPATTRRRCGGSRRCSGSPTCTRPARPPTRSR